MDNINLAQDLAFHILEQEDTILEQETLENIIYQFLLKYNI